MKMILAAIFILTLNIAWADGDGFVWSEKNDHGLRMGGRMKIVDVWGKEVIFVQSAVKNNSKKQVFIPVTYRDDKRIFGEKLVCEMKLVRDGDDPFANNQYVWSHMPKLNPDPFVQPMVEPICFVQLEPEEVVIFNPLIADERGGGKILSLIVKLNLKIEAPQGRRSTIKVIQIENGVLTETQPRNFDFGMIPIGDWTFDMKLNTETKQTEQVVAPTRSLTPTQKSTSDVRGLED